MDIDQDSLSSIFHRVRLTADIVVEYRKVLVSAGLEEGLIQLLVCDYQKEFLTQLRNYTGHILGVYIPPIRDQMIEVPEEVRDFLMFESKGWMKNGYSLLWDTVNPRIISHYHHFDGSDAEISFDLRPGENGTLTIQKED